MLTFNHLLTTSYQSLAHDDVSVNSYNSNKVQLKQNQKDAVIAILIDELKKGLLEVLNLKIVDENKNLFYNGMDSIKVAKFVNFLNEFQTYYKVSANEVYQHTSVRSLAQHLCLRFYAAQSDLKSNTVDTVLARFQQATQKSVTDNTKNMFYQGLDSINVYKFVELIEMSFPNVQLDVPQLYRLQTVEKVVQVIESQTEQVKEHCKDPVCNITKVLTKLTNFDQFDNEESIFYQGLDSNMVENFVKQLRSIYLDINIDSKDVYTNDSILKLATHIRSLL